MSIHVGSNLNHDQRICRRVSFYDLVELMTFGRLFFDQSARVRPESLRPSISNDKVKIRAAACEMSNLPSVTAGQVRAFSTSVVYQSWSLLEHEDSIDWGGDDASAPSIHIVSTIRALAASLFVGDELEVFIERASRFVHVPKQLRSTHSIAVPIVEDGTLTVTLWPRNCFAGRDHRLALRLPIDLSRLFTGVLVSPRAPSRFVELVSDLVRRTSHAKVVRAGLSFRAQSVGDA